MHYDLGIVGFGFSGLSILIQLVGQASKPLHIAILEKASSGLGKGVAYGTSQECHPLNVYAGNMGAYADDSGHFYSWLKTKYHDVSSESFLPRKLYSEYLNEQLQHTLQLAKKKHIVIDIFHEEASDISFQDNTYLIITPTKNLSTNHVVVAIGVPPVKALPFESNALISNPNYIHNLWNEHGQRFFQIPLKNEHIILIGSGLTTIDAILYLYFISFKGKVTVISANGQFPYNHSHFPLVKLQYYSLPEYPEKLGSLLKLLRSEWQRFANEEHDWRVFIDALRSETEKAWKQLGLNSKKQFFRHLFNFWNVRRHRTTSNSKAVLDVLKEKGQLEVIKAKVTNVISTKNGLQVEYIENKSMQADLVVNCSGPDFNLANSKNKLIQNMLKNGVAELDELGMGFKEGNGGKLAGKNNGQLYSLGGLLFGEKFETTSVPEIRAQANAIVKFILEN